MRTPSPRCPFTYPPFTISSLLALALFTPLTACGTPSGGPGAGERGSSQSAFCKAPTEVIGQQLAETSQSLNLTPKQLVLGENYQESVSAMMAEQMKQESPHSLRRTAVQQIESKVDTVRNRLTAMEEIAERAATLYRALDNAQKKIADQHLPGTVPALYSGMSCREGNEGAGERGKTGSGSRGGPGGGTGGMGRF